MRNSCLTLTAALLLIPHLAAAQQPASAAAATGTVDVGGMFTATDGDEARYERYRDTRDGAYTSLALNQETGSYLFNASASHIGPYGEGSPRHATYGWKGSPAMLLGSVVKGL